MQKKHLAFGICGLGLVALGISAFELVAGNGNEGRRLVEQSEHYKDLTSQTPAERGARLQAMLDKKDGVVPDVPSAPASDSLALPPSSPGPSMQASLPDKSAPVHPQSPAMASTPLNATGQDITPSQGARAIPVSASPPPASRPTAPAVVHARQPSIPDGPTLVLLSQAQNNISNTLLRIQGGMDSLEAKLASFAAGRAHDVGRLSQ